MNTHHFKTNYIHVKSGVNFPTSSQALEELPQEVDFELELLASTPSHLVGVGDNRC